MSTAKYSFIAIALLLASTSLAQAGRTDPPPPEDAPTFHVQPKHDVLYTAPLLSESGKYECAVVNVGSEPVRVQTRFYAVNGVEVAAAPTTAFCDVTGPREKCVTFSTAGFAAHCEITVLEGKKDNVRGVLLVRDSSFFITATAEAR